MNGEEDQDHPADDSWAVAIHRSENDCEPVGMGVVIDDRRVLTCAHVANGASSNAAGEDGDTKIWVAFPKAGQGDSTRRMPVARVNSAARLGPVSDLAVLHLDGPVPAGVIPAPLRRPKPADLVLKRWWGFGFPKGDPLGSAAWGIVGVALAHGWVQMDTQSEDLHRVTEGFSGGGLWSRDYRAVVGIVAQVKRGNGRAVTLHQADVWLPEEKIRSLAGRWSASQAGELAMTAWGWSLAEDDEGGRHWRPRARGVSIDAECGYRFQGRRAALTEIRDWLDRAEPERRVLVVTGAPGTGKSAVLGRIVTTADAGAAAQLPASDTGVRASTGSVGCAVHAKGKTALEVAAEIARAASAAIPERIEDFVPALREALAERRDRFNVVIDALDEAASPAQAREIAKVILPVAETCADVGAQVTVGSRRTDGGGDLLSAFGGAEQVIDLDDPQYFEQEDLAAYVLATLRLTGDERPGNPYADEAVAGPVAERIAALSDRNFLVAGLTARTCGLYDETAADPAALSFSPKADDAMREYLRRIPSAAGGVSAETLLVPLAFAEAPGLTAGLWRTALRALGAGDVPETALTVFARSSAASFLVESSGGDGAGASYRLFHQALNDALLRARARVSGYAGDEGSLAAAFLRDGRAVGWERAPSYLLRSLPGHAAAGGVLEGLLADDGYLLHADVRRVLQAGTRQGLPPDTPRMRLLSLTPGAAEAAPGDRAARFSVTEALEGLGTGYRDSGQPATYRARWAAARYRNEIRTLAGHGGWVWAVCAVPAGDRSLLASGSYDETVRLWDPVTGQHERTLTGHDDWVNAVCAVQAGDRSLLASGGHDGTVRLWDPATGQHERTLAGHGGPVNAVCAVPAGDRTLLASGSSDKTVRLWDPATGQHERTLAGHDGTVTAVGAVCVVQAGDRSLLATGSDGTVRLWDPATGQHERTLAGHGGTVLAVCAVQAGDRSLLASGSSDKTVRLWDPATGQHERTLAGHDDWVNAVCAVQAGDRTLLASGSRDGTVRLWDPVTGQHERTAGHGGAVWAVCAVPAGDRSLLATGDAVGKVRLWDPVTGQHERTLAGHGGTVLAVCAVPAGDRTLLASGSNDKTVRLWDPATGQHERTLAGHDGGVLAVCAVPAGDRTLLASGSYDETVRLWDPATGRCVLTAPAHHNALAVAPVAGALAIGLAAGVLVIAISPDLATGRSPALPGPVTPAGSSGLSFSVSGSTGHYAREMALPEPAWTAIVIGDLRSSCASGSFESGQHGWPWGSAGRPGR